MPKKRGTIPDYMRLKTVGGVTRFYFETPSWAKKAGEDDPRGKCPTLSKPLGTDYHSAKTEVETSLLPRFQDWMRGFTAIKQELTPGTIDWCFKTYRQSRKFTDLSVNQQKLHDKGFVLVGEYVTKQGDQLKNKPVSWLTAEKVDALYEKLRFNGKGDERRTFVNHAMKSCRRAWNVVERSHKQYFTQGNPFSQMGLKEKHEKVKAATYNDLLIFVAKADELGFPSLGTAAIVCFEWVQRVEHVFTHFKAEHYRAKDTPNHVRVLHPKTDQEVLMPLFDHKGIPFSPMLIARLDAVRSERIAGNMIVRDETKNPWVTDAGGLDNMRHRVKKIMKLAGLDAGLSMTSFRHGGFTEGGNASLTLFELKGMGGHKQTRTLEGYVKGTDDQLVNALTKRMAHRTKQA